MKRFFIILFIMTISNFSVMASSYNTLWKAVNAAREKDLPQTEIEVLDKIIAKARQEKAYGHLLKAEIGRIDARTRIAPDSLTTDMDKLIAQEKSETDEATKAVLQTVIGNIYECNGGAFENAEELKNDYYTRALSNPTLLAQTKSTGYEPFLISGDDSKVFNNDLLHVIGMTASNYKVMHDYYVKADNRPAACLTALMLMKNDRRQLETEVRKSKYIQQIDSLITEYKDIVECGEVAIERYDFMENADDATAEEKIQFINYALLNWGSWPRLNMLRNAKTRLTLPNFHISLESQVVLPNEPIMATIMEITNVQTLNLTVYPVNVNGDTTYDFEQLKSFAGKTPVFQESRRYFGLPAYKQTRDSIQIEGLPVGVYLVEVTTDNNDIATEPMLLYVSDIYVFHEQLPNQQVKIVCVNATTGQPIPGAKVRLRQRQWNGKVSNEETLTVDSKGEAIFNKRNKNVNSIYAYTDKDKAMKENNFGDNYSYYGRNQKRTYSQLFTDRSIYRPGQDVHVSVICYESDGKENVKAILGKDVELVLRDANYKEVAKKTVTTDDFGKAATVFTLPSSGLTGRFSILSNANSSVNFNVEEYKRPTFEVEFDKVTESYQDGDTVSVRGVAKSYAGVPVQGAKVALSVVRRPSRWIWWRNTNEPTVTILNDTLQTADDGSFTVKVPMHMPERWDGKQNRYYAFDVEADVTDVAGESHHGQISLPLSDKPTAFSLNIPEKMLASKIPDITFSYKNNAGEDVAADVHFTIDGGAQQTAKSNEPFKLGNIKLQSGRHIIDAVCQGDSLQKSFVVFSLTDKQPAVETDEWFYISESTFPTDGKPVYIQVGSSDPDQHIVYTIFSGSNIIEQGCIDQSNALTTRAFTYKPEYGDGLLATYAWVKKGKLHEKSFTIQKPLPDKRINVEWKTFRDRLEPGQKETWTLHLSRPDGTAANAALLAVLYDQSLDQIKSHQWNFNLSLSRSIPHTSWHKLNSREGSPMYLYGEQKVKFLDEKQFNFTHFDDINLAYQAVFMESAPMVRIRGTKAMAAKSAAVNLSMDSRELPVADQESSDKVFECVEVIGYGKNEAAEEGTSAKQASPQIRQNLKETAFFIDALTTDKNGNIDIDFTLPESVTTWRFMGLANDREMNNGMIEGETVAKKKVMIQPNMPRFLRQGDKATLSARISNTSEEDYKGNALIELLDPETEKVVLSKQVAFNVEAGKTTPVSFDISTDGLPEVMICRMTASGKGFSDGEQHYLPLLPSKEMVTNTLGFTQNTAGTKSIDLTKLIAVNDATTKLTVEYTNNPTWLMIQALPTVAHPQNDNAISLVTAYYANSIANNLLHQSPDIKKVIEQWQQETGEETSLMSNLEKNEELKALVLNETPWVMDATREADQKRMLRTYFDENTVNYRLNDQLSKLKRLQLADGSFTWWPGMPGSLYITTSVAETLIRLNHMLGENNKTSQLIQEAMHYMGKKAAKEVEELKKEEKKGHKNLRPSEMSLNYLYCLAISDMKPAGISQASIDYLINLVEKKTTELSIYGKARSAIILNHAGRSQRAAEYIESLRQYTVYLEEKGRYFDTKRALYSWRDYRIPSQVAAIEAIKALTPTDLNTKEEMQRWLLQEKRTQAWDTPVNSVDAVYAFLDGETSKLKTDPAKAAVLKVDGKQLELPKATAGLGYVKTAIPGSGAKVFEAEKKSEGTSWGAVYAQFMQPTAEVSAASAGMTVTREIIPLDKEKKDLKVGDRIKVKITITADRDYDFVEVIDRRAACLEPIGQLSGYHWGYYCTPRDNSTNYYFDRLAKGKHIVETTYYIDRAGEYASGTCIAQCAYSPEYSGRSEGMVIKVSE